MNRGSTVLSEPVTSPDQSVFHVAFEPGANPVGSTRRRRSSSMRPKAEGVVHDGLTSYRQAVFQ